MSPNKRVVLLALIIAGVILPVACFYFCMFNYVEMHEVGVGRNLTTGETFLQTPGVYVTMPWVQVTAIDTRPRRVCISSAARVLRCRLVEFVPEKYKALIEREGWHYYWWYNRLSFNIGHSEEYRGISELFWGYAFGNYSVNGQESFLREAE